MQDRVIRSQKRNFHMTQNMIFDDYDLDISDKAILTYCYISRCTDSDGQAYPSYSKIAESCRFSRSSAIRAIKVLQDVGLLSVIHRKNKDNPSLNSSNLYILYDEPNFDGKGYPLDLT